MAHGSKKAKGVVLQHKDPLAISAQVINLLSEKEMPKLFANKFHYLQLPAAVDFWKPLQVPRMTLEQRSPDVVANLFIRIVFCEEAEQ